MAQVRTPDIMIVPIDPSPGTQITFGPYHDDVNQSPRWIASAVLVALFAAGPSGLAQAKSFRFTSIEQDLYFKPDGTVRVSDVRTYSFDGTFSEAFLRVDPRSGGSVRFETVEALDGKAPARPRIAGNTITWDTPATNETRTFRIVYTLSGEVAVASDAAQFDRQVLEPEHAPVDNYVVRLHTPAQNPDPYRVFVFTGRSRIGTLDINTPSGVATVRINPVSEDEFVRTRVLMPASQFSVRTIQGNRFAQWIEEVRQETQGFRDASRGALERGGFAPEPPPPPWLPIALPIPWLGFLGVLFMVARSYLQFGREPQVQDIGRYYREPAEEVPPANVPFVLTQSSPGVGALGPAVSATLLDWARQGIVALQKHRSEGFLGIGARDETWFRLEREPPTPTPFEQRLWGVMRSAQGSDGVVSPTELRSRFQNSTSLASMMASSARDEYEQTHGPLLDKTTSRFTTPVMIVSFVVAAALFIFGFVLVGISQPLGLTMVGAGVLTLIVAIVGAIVLPRWNAPKLLNAKKWVAYRNFLSDFSQMETAPAEHFKLWDYHFVYAAALGVADKYLRNLRRLSEQRPGLITTPYWVNSYSSDGRTGNLDAAIDQLTSLNSLESIASNLKSLESGLSPKSSGSGGGFGGGSAGGSSGGGGSSGAR
jgi:uncharacterized membrane protein YgcG